MILSTVLSGRQPNVEVLLELLENIVPKARHGEWFADRSGSQELDAKFDQFNAKYFKGGLPKYGVYLGFNRYDQRSTFNHVFERSSLWH